MDITREMIEARLQQLIAERDNALAQFNAFVGAVNDCKHWLSVIAQEEQGAKEK